MRGGFTIFDIGLALLLLTVVGMIAIPGVLAELRVRDEVRAFRALQWIAAAQEHHRAEKGRFGHLDEIAAIAPTGGAWGDVPFDTAELGRDVAGLPGYRVAVLLPGPDGRPLLRRDARRISPDLAAHAFLAIAWPVEAGRTGDRAYCVNQDLLVLEHPNEAGEYSGRAYPGPPVERLASRKQGPVEIAPPPEGFDTALRREQEKDLAEKVPE